MDLNLSADISRADQLFRDIAKAAPERDIHEIQATIIRRVVEKAISYTPKASEEKMENDAHNRAYGALFKYRGAGWDYSRNQNDSTEWIVMAGGKEMYKASQKYPDAVWARVKPMLDEARGAVERKLNNFGMHGYRSVAYEDAVSTILKDLTARRGLTARTWLMCGYALDVMATAPDYIRSANVKGKQFPEDFKGWRWTEEGMPAMEFVNASPLIKNGFLHGAFGRAIKGQSDGFARAMLEAEKRKIEGAAAKWGAYVT